MVESSALEAIFGGRLTMKAELFQKTGSFKVRGLLTKTLLLSPEERERGVITVSVEAAPRERSPGRRGTPEYRRLW